MVYYFIDNGFDKDIEKYLNEGRYDFGICSWGSSIAVAGGRGTISHCAKCLTPYLKSVEVFMNAEKDINDGKWVLIEGEMKEARINCSMIAINKKLYVIAGITEHSSQGFSKTIDVVDLYLQKIEKNCITIKTELGNSISDCPSILYHDQIIIIKDGLIDSNKHGKKEALKSMYLLHININEGEAELEYCPDSMYLEPTKSYFALTSSYFFNESEHMLVPDYIQYGKSIEKYIKDNDCHHSSVISVEGGDKIELKSYKLLTIVGREIIKKE